MSKVNYYISKDNQFVIENYSQAPTFASFFPGIAGIFGCPMWVFYANRGQGITSAGVQDKDHAIIEFQPANKAYRQTPLQGFRTFIKVDNKFYEPFSEKSQHQSIMRIAPESLTISEENKTLKIRVEVNYFTLPHEPFPALARCVKITNLGSKPRKIELLDGLPMIIPFGFNNDLLKRLSTTIEAWCTVKNLESNAPFFKLKISPNDVSETTNINKGNFFLSFSHQDKQDLPVQLIVDPAQIFCQNSSLEIPCGFLAKGFRPATKQQTCGFTPSAFAFKKTGLAKGAGLELFSLFGQVDSLKALNKIKGQVCNKKYILKKAAENKALIDSICARMEIKSASKNFDLYSKQTFLDNVLRGGLPVKIDHKTIYLYYRKHGDMERDYNDFKLMPTYYSQGNGNYRDINQNRRCDIFFNPDLAEDNILRFFNLVQLDGFNPLVVYGSKFVFESRSKAGAILKKHLKKPTLEMTEQLIKPFALGELLKSFDQAEVIYKTSKEKLAEDLAGSALVQEEASHHEGFWIDHFCYNTDQLESFESIYPEKINQLLFDQKKFTYFDNDHIVVGRAVTADPAKRDLINSRRTNQNIVRKKFGQGTIYHTTLAAKILSIIINKAASFDPEGIGLEMEAGKPDWYDALNGLPALLGSSLSETLELKRLALYLQTHLSKETEISIPVETKRFLDQLKEQLTKTKNPFSYWEKTFQLKEDFRQKTKFGVSGRESTLGPKELEVFLDKVINKCDQGIKKCLKKYKNYYTYFINKVEGSHNNQTPLPLFLEGFVHALKVEKDKKIYGRVKKSPLYDKELKMYKVNASLEETPTEIGRARIFIPGWLENESIWLHMEYKYMLELLKAGLYKEFFTDLKNVMVPFLDPQKYKRSILENSSFLVSSAHPNPANHGRGFVARLSGATAEFVDMWLLMTTGKNIFSLDKNGQLRFKLSPILPAWLFKDKKLSFTLLGSIKVTYENPKGKNTFGSGGVSPISYTLKLDHKEITINKSFIPEAYAKMIRARQVYEIVVKLG